MKVYLIFQEEDPFGPGQLLGIYKNRKDAEEDLEYIYKNNNYCSKEELSIEEWEVD
jgi:hypothetical protein